MNPYIVMAFFAGAILPTQAAINTALSRHLGSPLASALISFLGGFISVAVIYLVMRPNVSLVSGLGTVPLWMVTGGLLGAVLVTSVIFMAPSIGVGTMMALIIGGQLIFSMLLDHFGVAGLEVKPLTLQKIIGAIILMIGVIWVTRSS